MKKCYPDSSRPTAKLKRDYLRRKKSKFVARKKLSLTDTERAEPSLSPRPSGSSFSRTASRSLPALWARLLRCPKLAHSLSPSQSAGPSSPRPDDKFWPATPKLLGDQKTRKGGKRSKKSRLWRASQGCQRDRPPPDVVSGVWGKHQPIRRDHQVIG